MSVTAKLGDVAPAKPLRETSFCNQKEVWYLNLDQIVSNTGQILEEVIAPVSKANNSTHWFDERHVLYSKLRPYLNKVVVPYKKGVATTELVPLMPDPKRLIREYLAYYLRSTKFVNWIKSQVDGAKMPRVSMKIFWEHEISLPTLSEQERIVAILDKATAIRSKRQAAMKLADDFLRATFLDMFGDPVTNQKGWKRSNLGKLIKVKSGNFLPANKMREGEVPVYGGNGINGYHDEYMFDKSMLVIGRVGVYCGAIHKTAPKSWITDNALYVEDKCDDVNDLYLEWSLRMANLNQYASQAGQPLISGGRIYPVEINVPPFHLQKIFEKIQLIQFDMREKLRISYSEGKDLFNSLTQRAFRGEL